MATDPVILTLKTCWLLSVAIVLCRGENPPEAASPDPTTTMSELDLLIQRKDNRWQPIFDLNAVSLEQCSALDLDYCYNQNSAQECADNDILFMECCSCATNAQIRGYFLQLAALNASQPLSLTMYGPRNLTDDMYTSIADILVNLNIWNEVDLHLSEFRSASIVLPQLVDLTLHNRSNIQIRRDDFLAFPGLISFFSGNGSTIKSIEFNAFASLPYLRHLTFEAGFDLASPLPDGLIVQMRTLHCGLEYAWLRKYLASRPYLLAPKEAGEMYDIGPGFQNNAITSADIFIPVDCTKPNSIESSRAGFSTLWSSTA